MIRVLQLRHPKTGRRVAVVDGTSLRLLKKFKSVYQIAVAAMETQSSLAEEISKNLSREVLAYEPVYRGKSAWRLLPAFDHPDEPSRCLVTGTGLTHRISAENRQAMHVKTKKKPEPTDSMKMFQW